MDSEDTHVEHEAKRRDVDARAYREAVEEAAKNEPMQQQNPASFAVPGPKQFERLVRSAVGSAPCTDEAAGGTGVDDQQAKGGATSRNSDAGRGQKRTNPEVYRKEDDDVDVGKVSARSHHAKRRQGPKEDGQKAHWREDDHRFEKKLEEDQRMSSMEIVRKALGARRISCRG